MLVFSWRAGYSSQLLFLGAEFTQVWARRYGSLREAAPDASSQRT